MRASLIGKTLPSVSQALSLIKRKQTREKLVDAVLLAVSKGKMPLVVGAEHINHEIELEMNLVK